MSVLLPTEQHISWPLFPPAEAGPVPFLKRGTYSFFFCFIKKYVQCRNAIKYRNLYGVFKSPMIRVGVRGAVAAPGV